MSSQAQTTTTAQVIQFPNTQSVDAQLEAKLARYQELKEAAREMEALKKELKPLFEGTERVEIGRFVIKGKYVSQPEKTVSAFTYWDMRITAI